MLASGPDAFDRIAALGTLLSAIAAAILVFFTGVQLRKLTRQVNLAAKQAQAAEDGVKAATDAVKAAEDAVRESARARADDAAHRLVVLIDAPRSDARVMVKRPVGGGNAAAHYLTLLRPLTSTAQTWQDSPVTPGTPFVLLDHANDVAWYLVHGVVINEGAGSARIRLDGDADFVKGERLLSPSGGWALTPDLPPRVGSPVAREYLLGPGKSAAFSWVVAHPLSDWADATENPNPPNPRGAAFLILTAMNSAANVVDHIYMDASARVLQKCDAARWMLLSTESTEWGTTVCPTKRTYLNEVTGAPRYEPAPWAETYSQ